MAKTLNPSSIKRSHKWDPKNPAAPVISMVLGIKFVR